MSELPSGWARTTLGTVADWGAGGTPSRSEPNFYGGKIPWIKSGELNSRYIKTTEESITEEAIKSSSAKIFPAGSVAIAMYGATIGKTAILGIDASTNQACAVGVPVKGLMGKEYLYRLLQNEKAAFIEKGKGGAQPNISQAVIKAHEIGLPPLAEQTRIAVKLDELLAQVDTLKARIDGIPVLLKRFRQSVLAAAVSGRLTRESYDSLSGTYALEPLGKLVAEPLRNGKSVKDGIGQRVLRLSALKKNSIDFFESKAGNWTGINFEQYIVKNDDFLISRGNGSKALVGRGGLARHVTNNVAYPDTMIRVRPDTQKLLPKFLATVWNSQLVRRQIESTARTTAGIWKISQGDLEVLKIPLPSLVEQREIVRSVEQLFAYTDHLETKIASAKSRIDHLTQSILTKAFRGELVPQDPNDEPAGALLDRIKAQRATAPKAKHGRQAATLG